MVLLDDGGNFSLYVDPSFGVNIYGQSVGTVENPQYELLLNLAAGNSFRY